MDINVIQVKESEFNTTIQMYQANGYQLEQTPETRNIHIEMDIINTAKKLKNLRNDVIELNNLEDCISYIKYIYD